MIWLVNLLAVLLCAQIIVFGVHDNVTTGLMQLCLAVVLLGWAGVVTVAGRKPREVPASRIAGLFKVPRVAETLLTAAYICGANSWLNVLSGKPDLRISTSASVFTGALCAVLFFRLARCQDQTGATSDRKGRKRVRAALAWIVLTGGFAAPAVVGVAWGEAGHSGPAITPELAASEISLAWLCCCALFLAAVLFRPWVMQTASKVLVPVLLAVAAILGISAALEKVWRQDWYLYTLTSLTFLGTALGVWRIVDSLFAATPEGSRVRLGEKPG